MSRGDFSLEALESRLRHTLRPVELPLEYFQRLRERVRYSPPQIVAARRMFEWEFWFIVIAGAFSTFVVILTLARALFYFFGRKQ